MTKFAYSFLILAGFGLGILFSQVILQEKDDPRSLPTEREYTSVSICDEVLANLPQDKVEVFTGEPAEVDFSSNPDAALFRTTISEQAKDGPNFAGHYTVATWGAGMERQGYAIIDAKTGRIIMYEPFMQFQVSDGLFFSVNSTILTLNPKSSDNDYLASIKGKSVAEMVQEDFEAHKARIYYRLNERENSVNLSTLCVENLLDGTF